MPRSSQPSIGDVMDVYQEPAGNEIINIAMADGLSGTYSSAVAAAESCRNAQDITVVNSRTLCGPHRYMVEKAAEMANRGALKKDILAKVQELIENNISFLIPSDFDYLRRGGRLSPLVSLVGKTIKLAPVLTQSEDGGQLVMSAVKRSFKQGVMHVIKELEERKVGAGWSIYITHADALTKAESALEMLKARFAEAKMEIHFLTPAFITQGGPGCVAVQAIKHA